MIFKNKLEKILITLLNKDNKGKITKEPKTILLLPYDNIGDMIMITPIFKLLRKQFPQAEISVLASQENKVIIENNPNVDKIFIFRNEGKINYWQIFKTIFKVRKTKYDLLIDFWRKLSFFQILKVRLIRAHFKTTPYKLNFYERSLGIKTHELKLYDRISGVKKNKHFAYYYLDQIKWLLSKIPKSMDYDIFYNKTAVLDKDFKEFNKHYQNTICLNLEAREIERTIGFEKTKDIINKLNDEFKNLGILLISHKRQKLAARCIADIFKNVKALPQMSKITELVPYLKFADLLITPDTAFVHLSIALNLKLIAIYSPNKGNLKRFRPLNNQTEIVYGKNNKMNSIEGFSTKELVEKAVKLLNC